MNGRDLAAGGPKALNLDEVSLMCVYLIRLDPCGIFVREVAV